MYLTDKQAPACLVPLDAKPPRIGYNSLASPLHRRPVISEQQTVQSQLSRLKRKRFWTPPALVAITTAYRFLNEPLSELIAAKLPASISPIAAFINESANAADPAFIGLATGFIIYWLAGEPWLAIGKELFSMGLKNFFQTAKQDAIDQLVAERADRLAAERVDQLVAERADQLAAERIAEARTETRAKTRNELLQELRKMTPEEIADLLAWETPATDSNSA